MTGTLDASAGVRVICYCDDCQAYARALQRDDVLDEWGGTDVFQAYPARVQLTGGVEHLRCLRLSETGMLRWHSGCCRTPIGNTMSKARIPFVGVLRSFTDHRAHPRDDVMGPGVRTQARFAPRMPPDGYARAPVGVMARAAWFLARGFVSGAHAPSPFFDAAGAPMVAPRVLSTSERDALR
jgi:hypothetical protein